MKSTIAIVSCSLVVATAFLTGCAADTESESSESAVTLAKAGEAGGTCGGFAGIACKTGLSCEVTDSHPDAQGTCVAKTTKKTLGGDIGAFCGGIAALTCKSGLTCVTTANIPDASGTCAEPLKGEPLGATCGGVAAIQCQAGLSCVLPPRSALDATGSCEKN
jgi:hypothetical protein